ncbi:unnamed protein product, partial [Polarella glacialis]
PSTASPRSLPIAMVAEPNSKDLQDRIGKDEIKIGDTPTTSPRLEDSTRESTNQAEAQKQGSLVLVPEAFKGSAVSDASRGPATAQGLGATMTLAEHEDLELVVSSALAASSRVRSLGQEAGPAEDLASEYSGSFMGFVEDTVEADSEVPDLGEYHIWFAGSPKSKTGSAHLQSMAASE